MFAMLAALAAISTAQTAHVPAGGRSQGVVPSSRQDFGMQCGIQNPLPQASLRFFRGAGGEWKKVSSDERPGPSDTGLARLWHEHTWMADLHDSAAPGLNVTQMHTGQMCFDPYGNIVRLLDRYMDMPGCNCMRFTSLTFDSATGRVVRRERYYLNASTGQPMDEPAGGKDFPEVWPYRRVDQLPFFSLVKQ